MPTRPDQLPAVTALAGSELVMVETIRTVSDATTNGTETVTSAIANFTANDVGHLIAGTFIPTPCYVGIVNSPTSIGLSTSPSGNIPVNAAGSGHGGTITLAALRQVAAQAVVTADDIALPFPQVNGGSLDASKFGVYVGTVTQSALFFLTGAVAGQVSRIRIRLVWDGLGPWGVGFVPAITWAAGSAPQFVTTAGAFANIEFQSVDGGTTWQALVLSQTLPPTAVPVVTIPVSGFGLTYDFANRQYDETLNGDTLHFFTGLQPGATLRVIMRQDVKGGHTPQFSAGVTWLAMPDGSSAQPTSPLQAAASIFTFVVDNDGLTIFGSRIDVAAQPPAAPVITGIVATTTTLTVSFTPPPINGNSPITNYGIVVFQAGVAVFGNATITPTATSTVVTGLTANTGYAVGLYAINATGTGASASRNVTTLGTGVTAPTAPLSLAATIDDKKTLISWATPASGAPGHYTVQTVGPGGTISSTPVQSVVINNSLGASTTLSTGFTTGFFFGNVGANKLVIVTHDNDSVGTRTVTVNGVLATKLGPGAGTSDSHVEIWEHQITSAEVGTKPTVTYTRTGVGITAGPISMEIYEWAGLGVANITDAGAAQFGQTSIPIPASPTLAAPVELAIAAFTYRDQGLTPSYSGGFSALNTNQRGSTAMQVTSSTAALSTAATVTITNGVGYLVTWQPAPAFSRTDTITPPAALSDLVSSLVDGQTYTITVTPFNAGGPGTPATTTVTPAAPVGGAGGKTALRAAIGSQQVHAVYFDGIDSQWAAVAPVGTIDWAWNFNTCVETDLSIALAEFATPSSPTNVFRFGNDSGGSGQWTIAEINAGTHDAAIDASGVSLQTLTVAQGKSQIIRPLYELDGNWMPWSVSTSTVANFAAAYARIVNRVKAKCASIKVDLCMSLGYGNGLTNVFSHSHILWDAVVAAIQALGVHLDYVDWDAYSNGPPGGTWLTDELAMVEQCAVRWGGQQGGTGCQVAHGEWGIGDPQNSQGPHNWDAVAWANTFVTWWESLPANTGGSSSPTPGSLGHIELFDVGGDLSQVDWRGVIFVPNPTSNPDGKRCASALKSAFT